MFMDNRTPNRGLSVVLSACFLSVVLSGCNTSDDDNSIVETSETETEQPLQGGTPTREDLIGVWEQTGYGLAVDIRSDGVETFEFTRASCLKTGDFGIEVIDEAIGTATISTDKMTFESIDPGELFSETYIKRTALPEFCEPDLRISDVTPSIVFDHVWHNFNDYYAFFTERQVDWEAQRATYQPQITDEMTDEQLFTVLSQMIDPLDDGHVSLTAQTDTFEAGFSPAADVNDFKNELIESFNQQTDFDDLDDYFDFQLNRARVLSYQTVINLQQAGPELEGAFPAAIYWGTMADNVGYINITRMLLFDEAFDFSTDDLNDIELEDDLQALNEILDRVMVDLQDTRAMIIDVRFNGGGADSESIQIVNRFATDRLQVISKFARSFNGESAIKRAETTPVSNPYTGPVAVLSSQQTASAAEIFLMAMNALPNVTLIGDESNGVLSDILGKSLPNEWEIGLSNEVYSDYQDRRYEVTGVPMDIKVKALSLADIEQGIDSALNEALSTF